MTKTLPDVRSNNAIILDRLKVLVADVFMADQAELSALSTAADVVGWDSVSQLQLLICIEDEFNIRIDYAVFSEAANLGDLAERIGSLGVT
jgi:acyl carrier protein